MKNVITLTACAVLLTACGYQRPGFTPVSQTMNSAQEEPAFDMPVMTKAEPKRAKGSLWNTGSNQFFKDSRARKVGDIVTVLVQETAKAEFEGNTETTKSHNTASGLSNLFNLEGILRGSHIIDPTSTDGSNNMIGLESNRTFTGEGKTDRDDALEAQITAVVTQVLPNGFLVIQGRREVVLNYDMQEITIQGVVRPEDISSNNTIESTKIAEARISYAGRGIIDDNQRPQAAAGFIDKWMPF